MVQGREGPEKGGPERGGPGEGVKEGSTDPRRKLAKGFGFFRFLIQVFWVYGLVTLKSWTQTLPFAIP